MATAQGLYAEGLNVSAATTTWVDVCTIAAGSFTAGKKYLILAVAHLRSDTSSSNETRVRLVHGTTPTLFTDANSAYEETLGNQDTVAGWMEVWTQPGTAELVKLQVSSSSTTTHRVLLGQIFALKLSDDFTENTDYFYNEVTADYTTTTSPSANQAAVTFTPNGTDTYLVIAQSAVDPAAITSPISQSIYESVANLNIPAIEVEAEDATNEYRQYILARTFVPNAVSHTFSTKFWGGAASNAVILSSRIFVLRLDKFAAFGAYYLEGEDQPSATWETEATLSVTPTVTGDWFYLGWLGNDVGSLSDNLEIRLQVNPDGGGLVSDPAYGDASPGQDSWDATDVTPFAIFNFRSLSSGAARTINLDCQLTSGTSLRVQTRTLAAFSMELASGLTNYVLWTTAGSFTWTRNNSLDFYNRVILETTGAYVWTRNDAKVAKGFPLKITTGTFTLAGQNAIELWKRKTFTTVGSFAWAGNNAIERYNRKTFTTVGSFVWAGNNAKLAKGWPLKTTIGTFTLAGQNANELWKRKTFTTTGSFVWAGNNAILDWHVLTNYFLWITTGGFAWTRNDVIERFNRKTFTTVGAFAWTRNDVIERFNRKTFTTPATFTWAGNNAIERYNRLTKTTVGGFALDGKNAIELWKHLTKTTTGQFTWTGLDANLIWLIVGSYKLFTNVGVFTFDGAEKLLAVRKIFTTTGPFVFAGNEKLLAKRKTFTTSGVLTLAGQNAIELWKHKTFTTTGAFTFAGNEKLLAGRKTLVTPGTFVLSSLGEKLLHNHKILVTPGGFVLVGNDAILRYLQLLKLLTETGQFDWSRMNAILGIGVGVESWGLAIPADKLFDIVTILDLTDSAIPSDKTYMTATGEDNG